MIFLKEIFLTLIHNNLKRHLKLHIPVFDAHTRSTWFPEVYDIQAVLLYDTSQII